MFDNVNAVNDVERMTKEHLRVAARVPEKTKRRLLKEVELSGYDESFIVRFALSELFSKYRNTTELGAAILKSRMEEAGK